MAPFDAVESLRTLANDLVFQSRELDREKRPKLCWKYSVLAGEQMLRLLDENAIPDGAHLRELLHHTEHHTRDDARHAAVFGLARDHWLPVVRPGWKPSGTCTLDRQFADTMLAIAELADTTEWVELAPAEIEKRLGMSWKTIRRRIEEGKIRAEQVHSKLWRVHPGELPQ